ncbi:calnexin 14d-related [Anaeramoeba flamelloides]|uniref:Calnexin 14d-related n=1 Tax=Anaeramoeba flamelloides TaxID=1746091 RepID=A0ABQ8Z1Q5_9EUKA|nr:calnexin 14d-related [Anaeramoeba flamelloides]
MPLFTETFDDPKLEGWEYTEDPKYQGKFDVKLPQFPFTIENDYGLAVMNNSQFYGISRPFSKPLDFSENGIIFHYTVRWQFPLNCGGAYVKFFREPKSGLFDPNTVNGLTPYSLMFGPDRCGAKSVVHFRVSTERKLEETQESKNYEKHLKKKANVPLNLIAHSYMLRGLGSEKAKEEDSEIDEEKQKLREQLIKQITRIKEKVSAIGLELWSVDAGIIIDDIWIGYGNQKKEYEAFYQKQIEPKITAHKNAHNQALNQNEGLDLFGGGGDDKKKTPVKPKKNSLN